MYNTAENGSFPLQEAWSKALMQAWQQTNKKLQTIFFQAANFTVL